MNASTTVAAGVGDVVDALDGMRERVAWGACVLAAVLGVQVIVWNPVTARLHLERPTAFSGDEPHYLVMLNALLLGDGLDLRRTYAAAEAGGPEAGQHAAGTRLEHHTVFLHAGRLWWTPRLWKRRPPRYEPARRPGVAAALDVAPEYSFHAYGWPLLLAVLVWPFVGVPTMIEPAALVVAGFCLVATIVALARLYRTAGQLAPPAARWLALGAVLATPLWAYGRSLFTEAALAALIAWIYALAWPLMERPRGAGALLGLAMLVKPQAAIFGVPVFARLVARRDWRTLRAAAAGPLLAGVVLAALNWWMYASPFRGANAVAVGGSLSECRRAPRVARARRAPYAPILVVALVGWFTLRVPARWVPLSACAGLAALTALWKLWGGGYCYGPRLLVPTFPLLLVGLAGVPRSYRALAYGLGTISFAINAVAALAPHDVFLRHPVTLLW